MEILEPRLWHRLHEGVIEGDGVKFYKKCLGEVINLYKYREAAVKLDPDTVVYEVYSYGEGEECREGNLLWGLTVLHPIYINGECNMTRGHFHLNRSCAEFYFGIEGEGLLLLMSDDGDVWAEKVQPGSLHYIDGRYAHRLINTGEKKLKVGACWPTSAGHDYSAIENQEFPVRIFKIDGRIEILDRRMTEQGG